MTHEDEKEVLKQALKEWLSEREAVVTATVGRWTIKTVAVAIVFALGYFILSYHGWKPPV